jgi:hypothetical protein
MRAAAVDDLLDLLVEHAGVFPIDLAADPDDLEVVDFGNR